MKSLLVTESTRHKSSNRKNVSIGRTSHVLPIYKVTAWSVRRSFDTSRSHREHSIAVGASEEYVVLTSAFQVLSRCTPTLSTANTAPSGSCWTASWTRPRRSNTDPTRPYEGRRATVPTAPTAPAVPSFAGDGNEEIPNRLHWKSK